MDIDSNPIVASDSSQAESSSQVGGPRVTNACEACRAAKVKCAASSSQLGICRRCYESKRECVFKTGPRTRRPRQSKRNPTAASQALPPPGPSKTFTIDIALPKEEQLLDFELLRDAHEGFIERLLPPESPAAAAAGSSSSSGGSTFGGSSWTNTTARSMSSSISTAAAAITTTAATAATLRRPQFNLDSATALLATFRDEISIHLPVASIPDDATVPDMARDRPFVLLAVLAAASGTRMAIRGGGSLYDEEFRKILGLKFVAEGERSVDLLVGLLVYCAWYPVHLRPKSKQSAQYIRMAVDVVQDLELDRPEYLDQHLDQSHEECLAGIRAYLACCYVNLARSTNYLAPVTLPYTPWTATCCDLLEREARTPGDRLLPWLLRHQHLVVEVAALVKDEDKGLRSQYQIATMLKGLEMQLDEYRTRMPEDVADTPVMKLAVLTAQIQLLTSHLWKLSAASRPAVIQRPNPHLDVARMRLALPHLAAAISFFLDETLLLTSAGGCGGRQLCNLSSVDWSRFVAIVILAFKLSFDMPGCPGWDAAQARSQINLGALLERIADGRRPAEDDDDMTVVGASRVVLGVVKAKFDKRMAAVRQQEQNSATTAARIWSLFGGGDAHTDLPLDKTVMGCPMFDGSMDSYIPAWDESFSSHTGSMVNMDPGCGTGDFSDTMGGEYAEQPFQDLWATMTIGWPDTEATGSC